MDRIEYWICYKLCVLFFVLSLSQTSTAQSYGEVIEKAAALHYGSLSTSEDLYGKFDIESLRPIQQMLEEWVENEMYSANDSLCAEHLNITFQELKNNKQQWPLAMIDAAAKPPAGILAGNLVWLGNYDECVNITATVFNGTNNTDPIHPFRGHYCKGIIPLTNNSKPNVLNPTGKFITIGICLPDSCSAATLVNLSRNVFMSAQCQKAELEYDTRAIVSIVFLSLLGALILAGTAYDVFVIHQLHIGTDGHRDDITAPLIPAAGSGVDNSGRNIRYRGYGTTETGNQETGGLLAEIKIREPSEIGICGRLLQAFSVYTSGSKILSTETRGGLLGALNGVRFISLSWVILGHAYVFAISIAENAGSFLAENVNNFSFMVMLNATVSVDSFFTLSGLLVGYLTLKELDRVGGVLQFRWAMFYFHRFWRLTPPYMLVMLLYIPLLKYWYNGPVWPQDGVELNYCESTWWQNILYINNFWPLLKQCMGWSWYLANDMQFYVVSPLFLIPLYKSSVVGGIVCFFGLLTTWTITGVLSSTHNLSLAMFGGNTPEEMQYSQDNIYVRPYCRIGPYIVGMLFGCVLAKTDCKIRMPKWINILGWVVAAGCCLSVLYANFDVQRGVQKANKDVSALYNALARSAWAVGVSWVIFACATGYGGIVNTFLSWKLFLPLSRLTYMAYLTHPLVIEVLYFGTRQTMYITNMEIAYTFLGIMMMTYAVSFVLSMAFESPFMGLEKVLLKRERKH